MNALTRNGAAGLLLLLGGCSTIGSLVGVQTRTENHDIPVASEINGERARKLYLIVVDGLRQQGRAQAALAFLDEYNRDYPNDPQAQRLYADCLVETGDGDKAAPLYSKLLHGPEAGAAYEGLGRIAASHRDWAGAAKQFAQAVRLNPSDAGDINDLGFALVRTGQYETGIGRLQQAAQLDPGSHVIRNNLILGLTLAGRSDEAARLVQTIADPADRDRATQLLHVSASGSAA